MLTEIARQLTSGEYTSYLQVFFILFSTFLEIILEMLTFYLLQPFQPVSTDFLGHLQPYAQRYIDEKREQAGVCYAVTFFFLKFCLPLFMSSILFN